MNNLSGLIVAIVIIGFALFGMFYSIMLQKSAVAKQAKAMLALDESRAYQKVAAEQAKDAVTQQREALELMRENNRVLKEILKCLEA